MYADRWVRGFLLLLLPIFTFLLVGSFVAIADTLAAFVFRNAPFVTAAVVAAAFTYHLFVVGDAFLRARQLRRGADYATFGAVMLVLALGYSTVYRESAPWAALAAKIFAPLALAPTGQSQAAPTWSGGDRLSILLLGIDSRGPESTTQNTDTMIVMSLDPLNKTASMLSVPRDILIDRPGVFVDKINAAYAFGGPDLSRRVVGDLLGVPIHAYAIVDFDAFDRIVDAVGGVLVDVKRPVRDEFFPTSDFGVERVDIRAGPQLMNGEAALTYARSRHDSSDYSRAKRQQDILLALRARFSQGDLRRVPGIVDSAGSLVRTNFEPANVLPLARLGSGLEGSAIKSEVLYPCGGGFPHCELRSNQCEGGCYLIPDEAQVRDLAAQLFYDPKVRQEAARVEVRGAGTRTGVARGIADRLSERAFAITTVTDGHQAARTAVLLRNGAKRYTADALATQLGGVPVQELPSTDGSTAEVVVRIGTDFRGLATDIVR